MKKLVAVTLLLLGSLFAVPISTHLAHGQFTGIVCLTRATSNNCPQVPLTFNATGVGKTFTIGVFIENSDAMGGIDIYVSVDTSYLTPISAAFGPLIASPTSTIICINSVSVVGACTVGTANGPGVVEVSALESQAGNECGGISPCSGMALTITYQVIGSTASTPFSYPRNSGCSTSSVTNPPNVCVNITDAFGTTLSETVQEGDFTDLTPTANFGATPTSGNAPLTVNFNATLSNATAGNVITQYNWDFGDGSSPANVTSGPTTSHVYSSPGTFHPNLETVDVSGKSSIKDGLTITVLLPDFSIDSNPTVLQILQGANKNATISLTSLRSFSGTVTISANSSASIGITSTLNQTSVTLSSGQTNSRTRLTVSAAISTPTGTYAINVTGTSGTLKHSVFITVTVIKPDFSITSNPNTLQIEPGKNENATISLTSMNTFSGTITLTANSSATLGITSTLNPTTVTLASGQTDSGTKLTVATSVSASPGTYTVNVTGTGGTLKHSVFITVTVVKPDFSVTSTPQSVSIPRGGNGNSIITLTGQFGFTGNVGLTASPNSTSIITFLDSTSVLVATGIRTNVTLYIIAKPSITPGDYRITVTGTSGPLTHSINVTINVPVPSFGASATPTSVSVNTGTNGTSAVTLIGLNGFTGNVNLTAPPPPSVDITTTLSNTTVSITSTSGPVTSTLLISTKATTPAGTYTITVNATTTSLRRLVNITLTVTSPLPSIQIGAASLSAVSLTAGKTVDMTFTVSNSGGTPVNVTLTMDVNGGSGGNITVAQKTLTLSPGQAAQTFTLSWNTTQWPAGSYHVYARVIGSQTSTVNQSQSAGVVALGSPPSPPPVADLSLIPWVTTGIASAIAAVFGLLLFRRRRPAGGMGSVQ